VWKWKYLTVKAAHAKLGPGVISLAGLSEGQVWVEVNFGERRKVFVEPFDQLTIESDSNAWNICMGVRWRQ